MTDTILPRVVLRQCPSDWTAERTGLVLAAIAKRDQKTLGDMGIHGGFSRDHCYTAYDYIKQGWVDAVFVFSPDHAG